MLVQSETFKVRLGKNGPMATESSVSGRLTGQSRAFQTPLVGVFYSFQDVCVYFFTYIQKRVKVGNSRVHFLRICGTFVVQQQCKLTWHSFEQFQHAVGCITVKPPRVDSTSFIVFKVNSSLS